MNTFIELPATKQSITSRTSTYGHGINDADYMVNQKVNGKKLMCPFYRAWKDMLTRCYSKKFQERYPTYLGCSVFKEWLTFSSFKSWMIKQDWEGKQLDKDLMVLGNKEYGPESCLFVSGAINALITDNSASRGCFPKGVCFHKKVGKYISQCAVNGKQKYLGYFTSIPEAEKAYLIFKSELIKRVAVDEEANNNPRLKSALLRHAELLKSKIKAMKQ